MSLINDPKIISVKIINDHALNIKLNNHATVELEMLDLMKYPGYSRLHDRNFFNNVKFEDDMIYWDDMHDMHIHQILEFGKVIL